MNIIISELFEPTKTYILGSYRGKHILEEYLGEYISEEDFIKIMIENGFKCNKKGQLNCRERKDLEK